MPLNFGFTGLKSLRRQKSTSNASSTDSSIYHFSSSDSYSTSSLQNFQISDPVPLIDIETQNTAEKIIKSDPRLVRARAESLSEIPGLNRTRTESLSESFGAKAFKPPLVRRPMSDVSNLQAAREPEFKKVLEFRTVKVLEELEYAREMSSWRKENWGGKFTLPQQFTAKEKAEKAGKAGKKKGKVFKDLD